MNRTRIKICGLTREQDVAEAVAAGVDAIGFVIYAKSARAVTAERAGELARLLPAFVTPVLLFVNETPEAIARACAQVPGAWLQFHGDETPHECRQIAQSLGRCWLRAARIPLEPVPGEPAFDLVKYAQDYSDAQAVLLDAHVDGYGGGGKTFNWSQLPQNVNAHLVLSGGLNAANVTDGIRALRNHGHSLAVDVSSGVESAKGIKDAAKIHEFVRAVRAADAEHPL
ncbi:TrpF Phosphoribosylanthranilate isomerase [Burkholderiaceae bacterium]